MYIHLCLASVFKRFFHVVYISNVFFFFFNAVYNSIVWINYSSFLHSPVDGNLNCFPFLVLLNDNAVNIPVYGLSVTKALISFSYISKVEIMCCKVGLGVAFYLVCSVVLPRTKIVNRESGNREVGKALESSVSGSLCKGRRAGPEKTPEEARRHSSHRCEPISSSTHCFGHCLWPVCLLHCLTHWQQHFGVDLVGRPFSFTHLAIHKVTLVMPMATSTLHTELIPFLTYIDGHGHPAAAQATHGRDLSLLSWLGPHHQKNQELPVDAPVSPAGCQLRDWRKQFSLRLSSAQQAVKWPTCQDGRGLWRHEMGAKQVAHPQPTGRSPHLWYLRLLPPLTEPNLLGEGKPFILRLPCSGE